MKNKQEYIERVKNQFLEEFNLHLTDDEIINIEEIKSWALLLFTVIKIIKFKLKK